MNVLTRVRPQALTGRKAVVASLIGAAVTAICAQIAFYLPGNPVPVTLQVFAVICCGLVLGSKLGAISQIEYLAAGLMGAPIFSGFKAGPAALMGPTGGYLIGFIAAAFVVGKLIEMVSDNKTTAAACAAGLGGVAVIYFFGVIWLAMWLKLTGAEYPNWASWALGVAPFVGMDTVKVVAASLICVGKR